MGTTGSSSQRGEGPSVGAGGSQREGTRIGIEWSDSEGVVYVVAKVSVVGFGACGLVSAC